MSHWRLKVGVGLLSLVGVGALATLLPRISNTAGIILFCCVLATIFAAITWVQSRLQKERRATAAAAAERFKTRLMNPDFAALEKHFRTSLPASFRAMYQHLELINSDDLLIGVPNPVEKSDECYVAWFIPADVESTRSSWPGCEGLFPFADNGAGDQFLVDLRQSDPEVIYYTHENAKSKSLGVSLSTFLAAPRRQQPDE